MSKSNIQGKAIATKDTKNGAMMLRPGLGHKETIKDSKIDNGGRRTMSNASRINPTASRKWLAARRELLLNSLAQPVVSPDRLFKCSPVLCVTSHTPDHDKTLLQRQITATNQQIDTVGLRVVRIER